MKFWESREEGSHSMDVNCVVQRVGCGRGALEEKLLSKAVWKSGSLSCAGNRLRQQRMDYVHDLFSSVQFSPVAQSCHDLLDLYSNKERLDFPVVQRLRIHLPMQGT
ncbi:unnamed protein product [Rangifer tarandus platyrhynchus]|uniref:Uncharacterized protein n=2 Tax=Rangifer tarandus platyrhynchus TaxID=3082113 RepID=A0ABN8XST3_RANTA|nr:unnamed protein product [Rangifer tarandus platyrhynchus]